jgi:hypothetical protein
MRTNALSAASSAFLSLDAPLRWTFTVISFEKSDGDHT